MGRLDVKGEEEGRRDNFVELTGKREQEGKCVHESSVLQYLVSEHHLWGVKTRRHGGTGGGTTACPNGRTKEGGLLHSLPLIGLSKFESEYVC